MNNFAVLTNAWIMVYHAEYSITASFNMIIWTYATKHW